MGTGTVVHGALGTLSGWSRNRPQFPQVSVAPAIGVVATAATIGSTNESSAENNRLMRHMAANRPTRRPRVVIPTVTPWSRCLLRGLYISGPAVAELALCPLGRHSAADEVCRRVVVDTAVALEDDGVLGAVEGEQRAV